MLPCTWYHKVSVLSVRVVIFFSFMSCACGQATRTNLRLWMGDVESYELVWLWPRAYAVREGRVGVALLSFLVV